MTALLFAGLEIALNRYLELDPAAVGKLAPLAGKVVAIELVGPDLNLYLLIDGSGVRILDAIEGTADTVLRGTPLALAKLGRDSSAGSGGVEIRGDVELGRRFKAVLDEMDVDWEEPLSRLTGDVVAHRVGSTVRELFGWGRQAADTLGRNLSEFLREESGLTPRKEEVEGFVAAVDTLRSDVDRLEARIKRLEGA